MMEGAHSKGRWMGHQIERQHHVEAPPSGRIQNPTVTHEREENTERKEKTQKQEKSLLALKDFQTESVSPERETATLLLMFSTD